MSPIKKKYGKRALGLLQTLSKSEITLFKKFVASPYFNTSAECSQLLKLLLSYVKKDTSPTIETISKQLKINDRYLSVITSNLTKLLIQFLTIEELKTQAPIAAHLQISALQKKEQQQLVENKFKELQRKQLLPSEDSPKNAIVLSSKKSLQGYFASFLLMSDHVDYYYKSKSFIPLNTDSIINALDEFYLAHRLFYTCEQVNRGLMDDKPSSQYRLDQLLGVFKDFIKGKELVEIFELMYQSVKDPKNEMYITKILALLKINGDKIAKRDLNYIYTLASNQYIRLALRNPDRYLYYNNRAFLVNKTQVENNHLHGAPYISPIRVINIISLACQNKAYDWAKNLLILIQPKLHQDPDKAKSIYSLNLAIILFYSNNFDDCQLELLKVGKVMPYYNISREFLLLKTYYELNAKLPFYKDFSKKFREFLRTNKHLNLTNKTAYRDFTNTLMKVAKLRYEFQNLYMDKQLKETKKRQLVTEISNKKVIQKQWLLDKVGTL